MRYKHKIDTIDALQWKGGLENAKEMHDFLAPSKQYTHTRIDPFKALSISTAKGIKVVQIGDYVVKGVMVAFTITHKTYLRKPTSQRKYETHLVHQVSARVRYDLRRLDLLVLPQLLERA